MLFTKDACGVKDIVAVQGGNPKSCRSIVNDHGYGNRLDKSTNIEDISDTVQKHLSIDLKRSNLPSCLLVVVQKVSTLGILQTQ